MKLCLLTFNLGKGFELQELLEVCDRYGYKGVECRAQADHKHGIELDTTADERAEIKEIFDAHTVNLAGISTSCRFESLDADERQEQVDIAKQFIDLAADVGAPRVRVFGNAFPEGADKDQVVENVGAALREIGEHAEGTGVDCNLEMHGDFYYWEYTLRAVELADHDRIGIVYNCDRRETDWGPIRTFIEPIAPYLRHVHMHNLEDTDYPYPEFFRIMKDLGYGEYCSLEAQGSDDPERVIALYARLFEWMYWNS
ncbi:MAG: sugar phosphate isomerase/epimerase family protein [Armatimonadota bacterium]